MAVGLPPFLATTFKYTRLCYAQECVPVPIKGVKASCVTIEVALAKRPLRTLLWTSVCRLGFSNLHLLSATALLDAYLLFYQGCCDRSEGAHTPLTEDAISWIILACVQLSCKFHEDEHWTNLKACRLWDMHSNNEVLTLAKFEAHVFSKLFCSHTSAFTPCFHFRPYNLRRYEIILRICTLDISTSTNSPYAPTIHSYTRKKNVKGEEIDYYLSTCSLDKYLSDLSEHQCAKKTIVDNTWFF